MEENELKAKLLANKYKIALAALACLLVSPVIFGIVQGALGLLALAAIGLTAVNLAPVAAMKLANLKMKAIVAEASKNPIETMKNVYLEKSKIIQEKDRKIVEFEGRLGDYHDKMAAFAKRYPDEAPKFAAVEAKMNLALSSMKRKQATAKQIQKEYKANIDKAEAIYAMACAAHEVTELAGNVEQAVWQDIKQQVSFDAVNHKFNTAVAALSMEVDSTDDANFQLEGGEIATLPPASMNTIETTDMSARRKAAHNEV